MATAFPTFLSGALPPIADIRASQHFWDELNETKRDRLKPWRPFLIHVAAGSPYLRILMARDADFLLGVLESGAAAIHDVILNEIKDTSRIEGRSAFMSSLRHLKAKAALAIALADISGFWAIDDVVEALTALADALVRASIDWLCLEASRAGKLTVADPQNPSQGSGYAVLAMGKHGARELNYSSDIDLIILYDPDTAPLSSGVEPSTFFVRMTKSFVSLLQDATEDGYVLRVDLRLRPDPRATQVAIAVEAAATYYENMGQNWERAAMIKARAVAGDMVLGEEFLARLKPYVWRKYLDFAAIADVQSLKRQIHAVKGHGQITVLGHNVKLGRGGIREIEFFVQTQQLIAGGRNPDLRGLRTLDMLEALAGAGWITKDAAGEMQDAYRFLRSVEHRLQMVNDAQTHILPASQEGFDAFAAFMGLGSMELAGKLRATFETVQSHYAALFEQAGNLGHDLGSLVFTGGEDDPETLETLTRLGFKQASEVSAAIRGWHFGRYSAMRSGRAREIMTELVPRLLSALAKSGDADQAFIAFDKFLAQLPAAVQLLSMLQANPQLLDLIGGILGTAPRLAAQMGAKPRILEAVLDPKFFGPLPTLVELRLLAMQVLPADLALEEVADRARVFGREQMFRIGARILSDTVGCEEAGAAFADLAQAILERLHEAVDREMIEKHGTVPGGASCVLAMGKLGGREMTAGSDLDLMVIYDHALDASASDGQRPLSPGQYYARLTQRLITLLTVKTSEGGLYDVDMRLRPSGSQGPVATSLESFRTYHRDSAWTWEKLALTRARTVAGDQNLAEAISFAAATSLSEARDVDATRRDVLDMRRLMLKEQVSTGLWDIKRVRGGLVEVEFIAQFLQIAHAARFPAVLSTNTADCLERLARQGVLNAEPHRQLLDACRLYQRLTQILRLCVQGPYAPKSSPQGLNALIAKAAGMPDIPTAEALLAETQARVAAIFNGIIGEPVSE